MPQVHVGWTPKSAQPFDKRNCLGLGATALKQRTSLVHNGPGSVRLRFGGETVRTVPVFGSGVSSRKRAFLCFSQYITEPERGRFQFRFRFLKNGSGGSGSAFGSLENGSDGFGFCGSVPGPPCFVHNNREECRDHRQVPTCVRNMSEPVNVTNGSC